MLFVWYCRQPRARLGPQEETAEDWRMGEVEFGNGEYLGKSRLG